MNGTTYNYCGDPLQKEFVGKDKNVLQKIREENSAQSFCLQQIVI